MATTNLTYDKCATQQAVRQSTAVFEHQMDLSKYHSCNKCFVPFGIVDAPSVAHTRGDLVDVDNELTGRTRPSTKCPHLKYMPQEPGATLKPERPHAGKKYEIDTSLKPLPECNFIERQGVPQPPQVNQYHPCEEKPSSEPPIAYNEPVKK